MTFYAEIMTGIAIGTGIGWLSSFLYLMRERQYSRLTEIDNWKLARQALIDETQERIGAFSLGFYEMSNGGGEFREGTPMYSTLLAEAFDDPEASIKREWQQRRVDEQYEEMMRKLRRDKVVFLRIEQMPGSELKRLYTAKGIEGSIKFEVYDKANSKYFYLVAKSRDKQATLSADKQYAQLESLVHKLNKLCRKYHTRGLFQ